jgi:hypothetical protein
MNIEYAGVFRQRAVAVKVARIFESNSTLFNLESEAEEKIGDDSLNFLAPTLSRSMGRVVTRKDIDELRRKIALVNRSQRHLDFCPVSERFIRMELCMALEDVVVGARVAGPWEHAPIGIKTPAYSVKIHPDYQEQISTPYGNLPHEGIAPNGGVFSFGEIYYFNELGQAAKYQDVYRITDEEDIADCYSPERLAQMPSFTFVPSADDTQITYVTTQDTLKIYKELDKVETGEYQITGWYPR